MRNHMSCRDLQELKAFSQVEPFGEERADYRAALIAHTTALCNGVKNIEVSDFLLDFDRKEKKQSVEQMKGILGSVFKPVGSE